MSRMSKIIESKRKLKQEFKSPPLALPVGMDRPETANQTMARLMLNSGVISRDDYDKMLGVIYDYSDDEIVDNEQFGVYDVMDDYKLSSFSQYEEELNGDSLWIDPNESAGASATDTSEVGGRGDIQSDSGDSDGVDGMASGDGEANTVD